MFTNAPPGLLFYGDPGIPKGFQNAPKALFSPRLGIVWDPTGSGHQTIRISGAILRDTIELNYNHVQDTNPPYGTRLTLTDPFFRPDLLQSLGRLSGRALRSRCPRPLPSNFTFPSGATVHCLPLTMKPAYMAQWNVSYQRQITPNWLAVSYLSRQQNDACAGRHRTSTRRCTYRAAASRRTTGGCSTCRIRRWERFTANHRRGRSGRQCQLQRPAAFDPAPVQPRVHTG